MITVSISRYKLWNFSGIFSHFLINFSGFFQLFFQIDITCAVKSISALHFMKEDTVTIPRKTLEDIQKFFAMYVKNMDKIEAALK